MYTDQADLVVVGAGPAGISAATAAARAGLRVVVADEQMEPGGKLHCQVHSDGGSGWWKGPQIARTLVAQALDAGVEIQTGTSVWGLYPGWKVGVQKGADPVRLIETKAVLLATGAQQISVPIPGWTLPGSVTSGAILFLVNQHRVKPGRRAVVVGTDPLSIMAAQALTWAGVEVVSIVLPPPGMLSGELARPASVIRELARHSSVAPGFAARLGGKMVQGAASARLAAQLYPKQGVRVFDVPLQLRRAALAIEGAKQVEAVRLADLTAEGKVVPGTEELVPVDLVVAGAGLSPLVDLAAQVGCRLVFAETLGGWVPVHGPNLETTVDGLFVAGSMTGVEGAKVAMAQGRLAGLSIASKSGCLVPPEAEMALMEARNSVVEARKGAPIEFYPDPAAGRERVAREWANLPAG